MESDAGGELPASSRMRCYGGNFSAGAVRVRRRPCRRAGNPIHRCTGNNRDAGRTTTQVPIRNRRTTHAALLPGTSRDAPRSRDAWARLCIPPGTPRGHRVPAQEAPRAPILRARVLSVSLRPSLPSLTAVSATALCRMRRTQPACQTGKPQVIASLSFFCHNEAEIRISEQVRNSAPEFIVEKSVRSGRRVDRGGYNSECR
jgi:hypothetical protein